MFGEKITAIFRRAHGKGVFPHQLAFTLLIPLRNWALSPRELLRRLAPAPTDRILEVGCGPAYFSPALAQAVPQGRLVLADIQPEMLAYARRRLYRRGFTRTEYYLCDGHGFDFPDHSFERIVLVTVLGEVADPAIYLREFHRLLTPEGILSVSESAGDPDRLSPEALQTLCARHGFVLHQQFGGRFSYTLNFKAGAHTASPDQTNYGPL